MKKLRDFKANGGFGRDTKSLAEWLAVSGFQGDFQSLRLTTCEEATRSHFGREGGGAFDRND